MFQFRCAKTYRPVPRRILGMLLILSLASRAHAQTGPVASAGVDQHVKVGHEVQLDATQSKGSPSLGAAPLTYIWQFVSVPVGSQAQLSDPSSPTPSFVPDLRGTYVAEVVALQASLTSLPAVVTITAAPDIAAHPIRTRVVKADGAVCMSLDGNSYCSDTSSSTGVFVMVLERSNLTVLDTKTFDTSSGYGGVATYLDGLDSYRIVIVSTLSASGAVSQLAPTLEKFGTTTGFRGAGDNMAFSVIGIRGLQTGQAWEIGDGTGLAGSFVQDSNGNFTLVQFDYVKYELVPSTTGPATITIGTAAPISSTTGAPGGFLMVVVDRATLATLQGAVNTYNTSGADAEAQQDAMSSALHQYAGNPTVMIFVASFGNPNQAVSPPDKNHYIHFNQLGQQIAALGGTYETFEGLGLSGKADTYSAVLGGGTSAESSSIRTPTAPQGILRGALGRGHQGNWYDVVSSSLTMSADLDFFAIIGQEPKGWPHPATDGEQKAFAWIGQQLCSCTDLRYAYSDTNISLSSWELRLTSTAYPDGQNFTLTDFTNVKNQLLDEFQYADCIQKFQANIATLWTDQQANFSLISTAVAQKVKDSLQPPPQSLYVKFLDFAIGKALAIAETVLSEGLIDVVNEVVEVKDPHSILQSLLDFGAQIAKDKLGNNAEQTPSIEDTVANLDQRAAYTFAQQLVALGTTFNVISEDWGKMQGLGAKLNNPQNKQWAWNGSKTTGILLQNLTVSLETGLYRSLMQDLYETREWHAASGYFDPGNFNDGNDLIPKHSWENWPADAFLSTNDTYVDPNWPYDPPAQPDKDIIWLDKTGNGGFNTKTVPPILQHLYARITDGGLAVYKPDVLRNWNLPRYYCYDADYSCDSTTPPQAGLGAPRPPAPRPPVPRPPVCPVSTSGVQQLSLPVQHSYSWPVGGNSPSTGCLTFGDR